jgi:hypothetical protein
VDQLADVLLQVEALDSDAAHAGGAVDLQRATDWHRRVPANYE